MSCVVICIVLGVDVFRGGPCPPLYIRGDRVTWKVLAEHSWSLIRVVTKEVRYIHELSLTLEHSMPVSSPTVPSLTHLAYRSSPIPVVHGMVVNREKDSSDFLVPENILSIS